MSCVICKVGETKAGRVTVTLERGTATLVMKGVPARVCTNCGEEYVDEETTARLLRVGSISQSAGSCVLCHTTTTRWGRA